MTEPFVQSSQKIAKVHHAFLVLYSFWAWTIALGIGLLGLVLVTLLPGVSKKRQIVRALARLGLLLGGIRYRIHDVHNLNTSEVQVIVSNHTSFLDVVILYATLPPYVTYVAKKELARAPLIGLFLRKIETVFLERARLRTGKEDLKDIERLVGEGTTVLFFPEGTFSDDPGLKAFKLGAFYVAAVTGAPVIPLVIRGARTIFCGANPVLRPGSVEVQVFSPLYVHKFDSTVRSRAQELREQARYTILRASGEGDSLQGQISVRPLISSNS
jgi:1-acyl-sn-glycerol-3-phosphate acyltransferase